MDKVIGGHY
jgi:translation initiation factor IF-2